MYLKMLLWTLVFLLSQSVDAQIGQVLDQKKPDIAGTWIYNNYGYEVRLILLKDGSGEMAGLPFTYVTEGNVLSISGSSGTTKYKYGLSENTLTLSEGDLETPVSFQRNANDLIKAEPQGTSENNVQESRFQTILLAPGKVQAEFYPSTKKVS
ncbi:MAG: hypothetical protein H6606_01410 [Flavobacteriales bacterium]|nr:hypothetical protein [Flavobacteriales bacterium]